MLSKSDKEKLKKILVAELTIAQENLALLKQSLQPVSPDNAIGRLSRMDALEMQSVNTTKLDLQQRRARQLELALNAIDLDKAFGECLECGQVINFERLKLMPESRYCVACQDTR